MCVRVGGGQSSVIRGVREGRGGKDGREFSFLTAWWMKLSFSLFDEQKTKITSNFKFMLCPCHLQIISLILTIIYLFVNALKILINNAECR